MSITAQLQEIADNVPKVYQAGFDDGAATGGGGNHYDTFWDAYQENGKLQYTLSLFAGYGWNDVTFKPKYSMAIPDPYMLFRQSNISDIGQSLKNQGVVFTIKHHTLQYSFNNIASKTLDNIVFETPITNMYTAFGTSKNLESIECPIPVQNANIDSGSFTNLPALVEVRFAGTIASNLLFTHSSKLSMDSVDSIIGALVDRTGTTAFTLTLHKDVGNKLTQAQKDAISAKNWTLAY